MIKITAYQCPAGDNKWKLDNKTRKGESKVDRSGRYQMGIKNPQLIPFGRFEWGKTVALDWDKESE